MSSPPPMSRLALQAGIDEAGLGPLLGPFALGFAGLWVPADRVTDGRWPWSALDHVVSEQPNQDGERLIVADSKLVHARHLRGRRRLERTVLSFWGWSRGQEQGSVATRDFLLGPLGPSADALTRHPWAQGLPEHLPLWNEPESIELSIAALDKSARSAGIEPGPLGVRLVPEAELNSAFDRLQNKSSALWEHTAAALHLLWTEGAQTARARAEAEPTTQALLTIDRQGGRSRYGSVLARALPEASVRLLEELPGDSRYSADARRGGFDCTVSFVEGGERQAFATALASCAAKYARELCMEAFNRHFCALAPSLAPTAGYTTDGRRWLQEAEQLLPSGTLDRELLVRRR